MIIDNIVSFINSFVGTVHCVFSSFITINYHVGDFIASLISYVYATLASALSTLFLVVSILIEDLIVFLKEVSETTTNCVALILNCVFIFGDFVYNILSGIGSSIITTIDTFISYINVFIRTVMFAVEKGGEVFQLVGHSLVLLTNLVPRTLYLLYLGLGNLVQVSKHTAVTSSQKLYQTVTEMSGEMLLGVISSVVLGFLGARFTARMVREHDITWGSLLRAAVWLLAALYIALFESIARCLRVTVRVMEMTVSNLRVPMFAHAGDSEDEDEDREHLVGEVEDSDDEENERREGRRRNYLLLLERAKNRKGGGSAGGSREGVEEELLREVEREREDKLCCICQDEEKCIMMLPCRHLCICERCQALLKNHGNSCPMCRRPVKQMIKAYL